MKKRILFVFACSAILACSLPAKAVTMISAMGVEEQVEDQQPTLTIDGNTVCVNGAAGMTLEVVSLTGRAVAAHNIEGPAQRIELNLPKGCYILKVGKVVRKVTVR